MEEISLTDICRRLMTGILEGIGMPIDDIDEEAAQLEERMWDIYSSLDYPYGETEAGLILYWQEGNITFQILS